MKGLAAVLAAACFAATATPAKPKLAHAVEVRVDASATTGAVNRNLVGVDWKLGTGDGVTELQPNLARTDIAFQSAARQPGSFDWSFSDAWVSEALAAGAEPMLILNYMPEWLSSHRGPGDPRDPTRLPPKDFAAWREIVSAGLERYTAPPFGVRFFEVWNEPDWPGFWQDTPAAFLETARHTALAVQEFREAYPEREIRFGGPACLFPDPMCISTWLTMMRSIDVRPDFVSWHYYGNYPFVGPDGREPSLPEPMWRALAHRNPAGGVGAFVAGIEVVRATVTAALAGSGWAMPELILDEWNVAAGGFDKRHDTHEGAAFDAGVLAELQRAGVDRAAIFLSKDAYVGSSHEYPVCVEGLGDWGLVTCAGKRKPAWWTFWLWQRLGSAQLATSGSNTADGFWAVGARDPGGRVTVMLSSFLSTGAHDHLVALEVAGLPRGGSVVTIRRLDDGVSSAAAPVQALTVTGPVARMEVALPENSVAFVEIA